ncbi:hypothetical protein UNDYM_2290 [Undibacterium sp. YM2]|nr:hypothetical protein UNDYM_2290 [Undibacterium sp. YM2]
MWLYKGIDIMSKSVKPVVRTVYRSSVDGEFVTAEYAKQHPRETEKQRIRLQSPPPPKKPR